MFTPRDVWTTESQIAVRRMGPATVLGWVLLVSRPEASGRQHRRKRAQGPTAAGSAHEQPSSNFDIRRADRLIRRLTYR
jgi:hypothetical protein